MTERHFHPSYSCLRCAGPRTSVALLAGTALFVAALVIGQPVSAQDANALLSARMTVGAVSVAAFPSRRAQSRIRHGVNGAVRVSLHRVVREDVDRAARRSTLTVCGAPAIRTERAFDAVPDVRVDDGDRHLIAPPRPRMTYVRVAWFREGRRYVVEWAVQSGRRAALRSLEDAFFASIRCE